MSGLLHAGAATEDVTPAIGCRLEGYARADPSTGILDRLELTALTLVRDRPVFVWIAVDHVGLYVWETDVIRGAVAAHCGIPLSHVMVSFSHTHSGPLADAAYLKLLREKAVAAVASSLRSLRPAAAGWGVVQADAGINRRPVREGRAHAGESPAGPVDSRVGVLRVDAFDRRPIAVLARYGAHANVLKADNLLVSADWPGAVRRALREALGCPVLVVNGSAGDVNPRWRGSPQDMTRVAAAVADPVLAAIGGIDVIPDVVVAAASETVDVALEDLPDPSTADRLAQDAETGWDICPQRWRAQVARRWEAGERTLRLPVAIQVARIGNARLAGVPMEAFAALALRFARCLPAHVSLLNGYTNGWIGYLPATDDLRYGGYEVAWAPVAHGAATGWIRPVRPGSPERLVDAAVRLAGSLDGS